MRRRRNPNQLSGMVGLGLAILLALAPTNALAQGDPPQGASPPKQPPPPLFPKHRRGIYRTSQGLEVIDATPQSPPLETDDPSVPDKGEYEINLTKGQPSDVSEHRLDTRGEKCRHLHTGRTHPLFRRRLRSHILRRRNEIDD